MSAAAVRKLPRERALDSTLALRRDPYGFIQTRCRRHRSDVFEARILARPTLCLSGPEAAALFYAGEGFTRHRAMPARIVRSLLGRGGVQGLDGSAHRARKALLLELLTGPAVDALAAQVEHTWRAALPAWQAHGEVVLYGALQEVLTRAVCAWAGVPLPEAEVSRRTRELTRLFDRAGAVGPPHWSARLARRRAERWIGDLVRTARAQPDAVSTPLAAVAHWRDPHGDRLPTRIAAVEVLNILRPTVAVSVYATLAAHALHVHPGVREALAGGEPDYAERFVDEVRRWYPFFPAVAARVREDFTWQGYRFPRGRRVLLDLHGTNRDPRTWRDPDAFHPERFREGGGAFGFVPQGGGEHAVTHRCPGEWITRAVMHVALRALTGGMRYRVPEQDLRLTRARLPALPRSRFVITDVAPGTWA